MAKAKKDDFKKKMQKLWQATKKELDVLAKDTKKVAKKSEIYLKDLSVKGKENLEIVTLNMKKDKLYYRLGKVTATIAKSKESYSKEELKVINEIRKIEAKVEKIEKGKKAREAKKAKKAQRPGKKTATRKKTVKK